MNHGSTTTCTCEKRIYTITSFLKGTSDRDTDLSNFKMCNFSVSTECKEAIFHCGMQAYSILEMSITGRGMGEREWCCIRRRPRVPGRHIWEISSPFPIKITIKHESFTTFRPKLWTKEHHNLHRQKRIHTNASFLKEKKATVRQTCQTHLHRISLACQEDENARGEWVLCNGSSMWQDCTCEITTINREIFTILSPEIWTEEHHNLHMSKQIYTISSRSKENERQRDRLVKLTRTEAV